VIIFFVIYFCGIWAFSSSRKNLLINLLRLEFVLSVLYFSIYLYLCKFNYSLFLLFIFLVFFSVCDGSLGLSVLVSMIRSHGNDYFQSYSVTIRTTRFQLQTLRSAHTVYLCVLYGSQKETAIISLYSIN